MRRRTLFLLAAIALFLLGGIGTGLVLLVLHEPAFYGRCAVSPGPKREALSSACVSRFLNLASFIKEGDTREEWGVEWTEAQLNSFFEEDFLKWPDAKTLKRLGVTALRVQLEPERLRLAFRYGKKPLSTIISFDIKAWLAPQETNVLVVEFLGRHAGNLPISGRSLLDAISEQISGKNAEVTWYRHEGNPVALIRLQTDKFQLRRLVMDKGKLIIGGLSFEPSPQARIP